jgi:hypothetical protein
VLVVEDRKYANPHGTVVKPALLDPRFAHLQTSGLTATATPGPDRMTLTVQRPRRPCGVSGINPARSQSPGVA